MATAKDTTSIRIDAVVLAKARAYAKSMDIDLSELVEGALKRAVEDRVGLLFSEDGIICVRLVADEDPGELRVREVGHRLDATASPRGSTPAARK